MIVSGILALLFLVYGWGLETLRPQILPAVGPNPAVGTRLSDAGFSFAVPWDDLDSEKTKYIGKLAVFVFRSGRAMNFFHRVPKKEICSVRLRRASTIKTAT